MLLLGSLKQKCPGRQVEDTGRRSGLAYELREREIDNLTPLTFSEPSFKKVYLHIWYTLVDLTG